MLFKEEEEMKRALLLQAIDADITIDLHCDSDAAVHMYTHDRLWPKLRDLAAGSLLFTPLFLAAFVHYILVKSF